MTKSKEQSADQEIKKLFDLGAHMGHKKSRLHPKSASYVYTILNGISIIDLTKTVDLLHEAEAFLAQQAAADKKVLVVATKKVGSGVTAELCKKHGISYITTKWLPGLLTNFKTLINNVKKLRTLKEDRASGEWDKYVKHEQTKLTKKINRLQKFYGGLEDMHGMPDLMLILDIKKERNAVIEAQKNNIPIVAVVDTNANPDIIPYPVVANDDAPEVVEYLMTRLIEAYAEGKKQAPVKEEKAAKQDKQSNTPEKEEKKTAKAADTKEKAEKKGNTEKKGTEKGQTKKETGTKAETKAKKTKSAENKKASK
jgi:small subunit ribosomal protein S2